MLLRQHDNFHITNAYIIPFSLRFLRYYFYIIEVLHQNNAMLSIIFSPFLIHHTANIKAAGKKNLQTGFVFVLHDLYADGPGA